jgi:DNA-directed RNA polymerase subunit beta
LVQSPAVQFGDVNGRSHVYKMIGKGQNLLEPGIPESFYVLFKELQVLGLSVKLGQYDRPEEEKADGDQPDEARALECE